MVYNFKNINELFKLDTEFIENPYQGDKKCYIFVIQNVLLAKKERNG
ncbi:MAG: hypothetical protein K0S61_871 [Anaerocolumna sp.]|jgi:hypothetical protein|nr:hypothetical protein [Anaerocolumna sp.]